MTPIRIQRKRIKGWRMPENTVSVTKPGRFGNNYKIGDHNVFAIYHYDLGKSFKDILIERNGENKYYTPQDVVDAFEERVKASQAFQRVIKHYLKDKNLACWCNPDQPCHADILLKYANL